MSGLCLSKIYLDHPYKIGAHITLFSLTLNYFLHNSNTVRNYIYIYTVYIVYYLYTIYNI